MLSAFITCLVLLGTVIVNGDDDVVHATESDFNEEVIESNLPVLVEFFAPWCGHCKNLIPAYAQAATELKGAVKLVAVDATVATSLAQRYGVNGYPTIKFFPPGAKDTPIDFDGGRSSEAIVEWCFKKLEEYGGVQVQEFTDDATWHSECLEKKVCVVGILPHLMDGGAAARKGYIEVLQKVAAVVRRKPVAVGWIQGGAHNDFEEKFGVGGFGYPALVCISRSKMRVGLHRRAFTEQAIVDTLDLMIKGMGTRDIKVLPRLNTVDGWNGEEYVPEPEEDYN